MEWTHPLSNQKCGCCSIVLIRYIPHAALSISGWSGISPHSTLTQLPVTDQSKPKERTTFELDPASHTKWLVCIWRKAFIHHIFFATEFIPYYIDSGMVSMIISSTCPCESLVCILYCFPEKRFIFNVKEHQVKYWRKYPIQLICFCWA